MNADQLEQVLMAIVDGKYSWACVLILRYAGYNPAHYLPYRTYKRLIKDNRTRQFAESDRPSFSTEPHRSSLSASASIDLVRR